jgi:prephenate dehydratase
MTRVAIQGVAGSYSEQAAREICGSEVSILECRNFADAFGAVTLGNADNAVVPVANKIVGEIKQAMDLLRAGQFRVLENLPLKVLHVLAGTSEAGEDELVSVRSHVEALKQCRNFFTLNSHLAQIVGADTASSVRRIVEEGDATHAAIGSRRAAELYGAKILCENVADDIDNWTTFYLIGN